MLINHTTDLIELVNSIQPTKGYAKGGEGSEEILTIVCGVNGMIVISPQVLQHLEYPDYVGFGTFLNGLEVKTNIQDENAEQVIYVGAMGIVQNPKLVFGIAESLNLDCQEGSVHQMYIVRCSDLGGKISAQFLIAKPHKFVAKVQSETVDTNQITYGNEGEEPKGSRTLRIDTSLGMIRMAKVTYQGLFEPELVQFGFYEGYLVITTGLINSREMEVQYTGYEGIVQNAGLANEIAQKLGLGERKGRSFEMRLIEEKEFGEEAYHFFALAKDISR